MSLKLFPRVCNRPFLNRLYRLLADIAVTFVLWGYYTAGFVVFFAPRYCWAYFFSEDVETAFQRLNHRFYRGFLGMIGILIPAHKWCIETAVRDIRSSVIVSNHVSYIDPILLISLYERHTTIAKTRLFNIPLYGRMLSLSGYIPSSAEGKLVDLMLERVESMGAFLKKGGNLFIFPEGTRSRSGRIGQLHKGAFKIARLCKAPIKVIFIQNTDKLYKPGRFLFSTQVPNTITVEQLAEINPEQGADNFSINRLTAEVRGLLEARNAEGGFPRSVSSESRDSCAWGGL